MEIDLKIGETVTVVTDDSVIEISMVEYHPTMIIRFPHKTITIVRWRVEQGTKRQIFGYGSGEFQTLSKPLEQELEERADE